MSLHRKLARMPMLHSVAEFQLYVKFCVIIVLKFKNCYSDVMYVWFSSSVPFVSRGESFVLRHGISGEV